jgi:hypothetical protein
MDQGRGGMTDAELADARSTLNHTIIREVGPQALVILHALIKQLPNGQHMEGWFCPDHKAIMTERGKMSISVYYHLIAKLMDKGYLERKRKMADAKRGIWYKINFDRMTDILLGEKGKG